MRHRLLDVDVLPGTHGVDDDLPVPVIRSRDNDAINFSVAQEILITPRHREIGTRDLARETGELAPIASEMRIFMLIYFAMTGMHALHMVIGIAVLAVITWMAHKRQFTPQWYAPVEIFGLYWHFVDIVWIFLFPLLYLVNRHG